MDDEAHYDQARNLRFGVLAGIVSTVRDGNDNSDSIATGSAQIASGNADLSQRTDEQASPLQPAAASMKQLTAALKHNVDNARQANQPVQGAPTMACRAARWWAGSWPP